MTYFHAVKGRIIAMLATRCKYLAKRATLTVSGQWGERMTDIDAVLISNNGEVVVVKYPIEMEG